MKVNANYIPMGTGPYKYNSQLSTGSCCFRHLTIITTQSKNRQPLCLYRTRLAEVESMFEASEIDLMTGRTVDLSEYTPRGSARNNEYITNQMTFIGYNTANPLFRALKQDRACRILLIRTVSKFNDIFAR